MCNAHNHPPGCTCGWGGGWHSNSYGGHWSSTPNLTSWANHIPLSANRNLSSRESIYHRSSPAIGKLNQEQLRSGWTNPNAKCPVCGCPVYFFQATDGGRVFFDELGPPWPKHSCTDVLSSTATLGDATQPQSQKRRWDQDGWYSLDNPRVFRIGERTLRKVRGVCGDLEVSFLFRVSPDIDLKAVRFRELEIDHFELSFLGMVFKTRLVPVDSGRGATA